MRDEDVDALEREITADDLAAPCDAQEQARVDNARRRLADRELLDGLAETGFTGPLLDMFVNELAAYGIAALMAWMRTGEIARQCTARGRPLAGGPPTGQLPRDDRLEIAVETTARALKFFVDNVLKENKWDHRRGATLKTFFIGSCLLQFPNVYDLWVGEQKRWGLVNAAAADEGDPAEAPGAAGNEAHWSDPTAEAVIRREIRREALGAIRDPRTRTAAEMVMRGYSFAEAGAAVGLTAAAVEGRLYRLRKGGENERRRRPGDA